MAKIKLFGGLRKFTPAHQYELPALTVRDLLAAMSVENPALGEAIMEQEGLRAHVRIAVNGRDIELLDGLETHLETYDQVAIFPPIAGG